MTAMISNQPISAATASTLRQASSFLLRRQQATGEDASRCEATDEMVEVHGLASAFRNSASISTAFPTAHSRINSKNDLI